MQRTMKRVILSLVAVVAALSVQAQVRTQTNHTISTTLGAGLEYAFEWAPGLGNATLVARAGAASRTWTLSSALDAFFWTTTMAPAVTLEPRYYFLMDWRERNGKYTRGNSAEFVGVPVTAYFNQKGFGELVVTPQLGVRRAFAKHWFHEFTAGADLLCLPSFKATPHVGYRIGFLF